MKVRRPVRHREAPGSGVSPADPSNRDDMTASPVPDLGTLRSICQGEKVRQDRRPWYVLSRRVSIGITWWLLHTPVTANQVTFTSLVLTIVAGVLIAMPSPVIALAGLWANTRRAMPRRLVKLWNQLCA